MSLARWALWTISALLLSACGDKPQAAGKRIADTPAYAGATGTHQASGWKAGDAAAWETQMRERAKAQNEYARISAP